MKTITMEFSEYNAELQGQRRIGYNAAKGKMFQIIKIASNKNLKASDFLDALLEIDDGDTEFITNCFRAAGRSIDEIDLENSEREANYKI